MTNPDYNKIYWQYCRDVLNNKIITGKYIKLACQRMMNWCSRDDIYFDEADVDKKIKFVSKFKLEDGQPFILLPFQQWIFANIYGWKFVNDPEIRVITKALIFTARKSGKSTFAAAIALIAVLCDNEPHPEVAFIANSAKQAGLLFKYCRNLCETIDPKGKIFHTTRTDVKIDAVHGQINVLSADVSKHDGRRDSLFIQDEGHAARDSEIWDILKTGQVQRRRPLAISISTAGFNVGDAYPLYAQWKNCCNILNNTVKDDSWFAALYQLDEDDDWKDESVWIKANPSLGTTVTLRSLREQVDTAINIPGEEVSIRTKNMNQWVQSQNVWLPYDMLMDISEEVNLDDYAGEECFGGIDLSISDDLSAMSVCFPPNEDRKVNPDKFVFKTFLYIPQEGMSRSKNKTTFDEWLRRGWAIKTAGNVVDTDRVLMDLLNISKSVEFIDIGYDRYNANQFAQIAEDQGLPMAVYSQGLGNFNEPTKFFEALVFSKKCIIDTNPAVMWCFSNVEIKEDHNENKKPVKSNGDKTKKIDPVISILESLGCYIYSSRFDPKLWVIQK